MNNTTDSDRQGSLWLRLVYMILFLIVYSVSETIVVLTTVVAFIFCLVGKPVPPRILYVGRSFARFIEEVIVFLTFNSEQRPFPFSPWPDVSQEMTRTSTTDHP